MKKIYKNYYKFSVAPMLNYTDKHCLFMFRQLSKKTLLYTEMIHINEILKKNFQKKNYIFKKKNPIAIQLAGNKPKLFAKCAKFLQNFQYDEINLNLGCPSKTAQLGNFGISLMKRPKLILKIMQAIFENSDIPISIKMRIGTSKCSKYIKLKEFIQKISEKKYCNRFIIHARIADLEIKNPKMNRMIPPLNYSYVYKIKKDFPKLKIILNGGIKNLTEVKQHLKKIDGVMLGRNIYKNPFILNEIDKTLYHTKKNINLKKILKKIGRYIDQEKKNGTSIYHIIRHILNFFKGYKNVKKWKNYILQNINTNKKYSEILTKSLKILNF